MTFEEAVKLLETTPSPFQLSRHMADITSGMRNLADRFDVVEQSRVDDMHRMQGIEEVTKTERDTIASIAKDRDVLQKQVADLSQRLDALEKAKQTPIHGTAGYTPGAPVPPAFPSKASSTFADTFGAKSAVPA